MRWFPLFLRVAGERVVIAGGGEQAAQKLRLMLKTEADLTLMAPTLEPELAEAAAAGRARHHPAVADPAALVGARLLFCATGCAGADAALAALGRAHGAVVNVVDRPDFCDAITPAIVDRDPVVVAIGTEGAAPVLARGIKTALEQMLEPDLGALAAWAEELRPEVAHRLSQPRRRAFWAWFFGPDLRARWREGGRAAAAPLVAAALAGGGAPAAPGAVSVVAAGRDAPDLIALRGVQRLQEADLVLHDADMHPGVLELARRDAAREIAAPGSCGQVAAEAAAEGRRVVRLVGGDPAAAAAALRAAGVSPEIVPGPGC